MNEDWKKAKKILCIRPDNMGDVIMSSPAIRALKESIGCSITLLASPSGSQIAKYIPEIDDVISVNLPWVKTFEESISSTQLLMKIEKLKLKKFDGAIIFNVYSQNPWAAILTAYLAGIPLRLAYSREKPYNLLTDWVPDPEPQKYILHETERQLNLVKSIGAVTNNPKYRLHYSNYVLKSLINKLNSLGINSNKKIVVVHPGVSSEKRQYSPVGFAKAAQQLYRGTGYQIVYTGNKEERNLAYEIQGRSQIPSTNLAGILSLEEFIAFLDIADLLISNNTGPVHIASALGTPVVDLYALTNPQHTPWMVESEVLYFEVPKNLAVNLVSTQIPRNAKPLLTYKTVVEAALRLLRSKGTNKNMNQSIYL